MKVSQEGLPRGLCLRDAELCPEQLDGSGVREWPLREEAVCWVWRILGPQTER